MPDSMDGGFTAKCLDDARYCESSEFSERYKSFLNWDKPGSIRSFNLAASIYET